MPGRPIGTRLAVWTAGLAVLGALVVVGAPPVAADSPTPPPWVIGQLQPGQFVAYTLSSTNVPVFQRNPAQLWGPVTLNRETNVTALTGVIASEGSPPGWPSTFSSNGVTLKRADQFCDIGQPSCRYYVAGGSGQPFFFAASGGGGAPDLARFDQGPLVLAPIQPVVAQFAPPTGGTLPSAGSFTFDGSGSSGGIPGALTYHWTLTPANGTPFTQDGPSSTFTPPASVFSQNGQYCLTLLVTASDGATNSAGPSCFAVTISNPTPAPPQNPAPPQAPGPGPPAAPGPAPAPAASSAPAAPLSFAKPLPNFAVPVAGAVQQVTVIWLWKPDWFQSTAAGRAVKTGGTPKAVKRASVSVSQNGNRSSPSAAPWLAGLGAFGIFGAGWLAYRRRNLRSSLLD